MLENKTDKIQKTLNLYKLISEKEKIINIIDKDKIIHCYKLVNFNNNDPIDRLIILISKILGKNVYILIEIYYIVRKSSIGIKIFGKLEETTFMDIINDYMLPICRGMSTFLRSLGTLFYLLGYYNSLPFLYHLLLNTTSYFLLFSQFCSGLRYAIMIKNRILKIDFNKIRSDLYDFFEKNEDLIYSNLN